MEDADLKTYGQAVRFRGWFNNPMRKFLREFAAMRGISLRQLNRELRKLNEESK